MTYAQYGEDETIDRLLGHPASGFYVDVGAHDPDKLSVTRLFYERGHGWSGINIEPNPNKAALFAEARRRDLNLQIGISDVAGAMKLVLAPGGAGSTMVPEYAEKWGPKAPRVTVKVVTLKDILDTYVRHLGITFLKVDVEGYEAAVLRSNDWSTYRPKLACIETTRPYSRVRTSDIIDDIMAGAGYRAVYMDELNTYYMDARA